MKARGSMRRALGLGAGGLSLFWMLAGAAGARAQDMYDPPPPYDDPVPMESVPRIPHPGYGPDEYDYPPEPVPEEMFHRRPPGMAVAPEIYDIDRPRPIPRGLSEPGFRPRDAGVVREAIAPRHAPKTAAPRASRVPPPQKALAVARPPAQGVAARQAAHQPASPQDRGRAAAPSAVRAPAPPAPQMTDAEAVQAHKGRDATSLPMNAGEGKSNIDR